MGIFDFLKSKKENENKTALTSILPQEIYEAGILELQDIREGILILKNKLINI